MSQARDRGLQGHGSLSEARTLRVDITSAPGRILGRREHSGRCFPQRSKRTSTFPGHFTRLVIRARICARGRSRAGLPRERGLLRAGGSAKASPLLHLEAPSFCAHHALSYDPSPPIHSQPLHLAAASPRRRLNRRRFSNLVAPHTPTAGG